MWNIPTEGNFSNLPKHWLLSLGPFCNQKALKVKMSEYSNINNFEIWITQCHRIFCTNRYMYIYIITFDLPLSLSFSLLYIYIYAPKKKMIGLEKENSFRLLAIFDLIHAQSWGFRNLMTPRSRRPRCQSMRKTNLEVQSTKEYTPWN